MTRFSSLPSPKKNPDTGPMVLARKTNRSSAASMLITSLGIQAPVYAYAFQKMTNPPAKTAAAQVHRCPGRFRTSISVTMQ